VRIWHCPELIFSEVEGRFMNGPLAFLSSHVDKSQDVLMPALMSRLKFQSNNAPREIESTSIHDRFTMKKHEFSNTSEQVLFPRIELLMPEC
jgi:hypothetical protein